MNESDLATERRGTAEKSAARRRVLFVCNAASRFVRIDADALSERYDVRECLVGRNAADIAHSVARVPGCDLVFGWFASWHTLGPVWAARALGRPAVLVVGGYDTANLPEIGYGHQRGGLPRVVSRLAIRGASRLIVNSHYAKGELEQAVPDAGGKATVAYHGLPDPFGSIDVHAKTERLVLTVGNVNQSNVQRKGLAAFCRAAHFLPDHSFVVVGAIRDASIEGLRKLAPRNVQFTGAVDDQTLTAYYRRASVYLQPSAHEAFGMSVAEAMLGGCIAVVSNAGSLPEVVGPDGILAHSTDPEELATAVRRAETLPPSAREAARQRVLTEFSIERRRNLLFSVIDRALSDARRGLDEFVAASPVR